MKNPYLEPPLRLPEESPEKTSKESARKEASKLREAIEHHNYLYYVRNRPAISDGEFDELFERLQAIEDTFPSLRDSTSPTQRVGAPPQDELQRVEHFAPMLSLDSAVEEKEVEKFFAFLDRELGAPGRKVVLEPKLDGFSVEVVYRNGRFERGATRGDGTVGEDISVNLKTIPTIPLHLREDSPIPPLLVLRGEVFMTKSGFHELNERREKEGREPFANPRNAAAGSVRQLDSRETAKVPLDVFFYEVLYVEGLEDDSHESRLGKFPSWGLKTNPLNEVVQSFQEISAYYDRILSQREQLDYEIDGVVVKADSSRDREKLGRRNRNPRWAMAWKFPPRQKTTHLESIDVQVGRTGILTPVAKLEPVTIGGATVRRASLHNAEEVWRKDIRPGDTVRVQRAGDVIPEVTEVVNPDRQDRRDPFTMPARCPACGTEVQRDGVYHVCPAGLACPPQLRGSLEHFVSREAMDIEHLGEKNCELLIEHDLVQSVADLYTLSSGELEELPGFGEKAAANVVEAIDGSKRPPLSRFIYALGIRHVGNHLAEILSRAYPELEALRRARKEELLEVEEIGPETAESVVSFFSNRENNRIVDELLDRGVTPRALSRRTGRLPLEGSTFVITGSLERYTRKEATKKIESLGGKVTSSVSSNTDYLICGNDPGTKLDDARAEGTAILEEEDFLQLIGEA